MAQEAIDIAENEYRTSDMALVTFLKQRGQTAQDVYYEDDTKTVYWTFVPIPTLMTLLEEFASGSATVEPKEYARIFHQTKREMYSEADPHRSN
jgi:hypothetical protein